MANASRKIFVGNIPFDTTQVEFEDFLAKYGETDDAIVMIDRATGKHRGFGFVMFKDAKDGEEFMRQNLMMRGRDLHLEWASPKTNHDQESKRLKVSGLPHHISDDSFRGAFDGYGRINECYVARDPRGRPEGFGFVTFESIESARKLANDRDYRIDGRRVKIAFDLDGGGGRGDGRRGGGGGGSEWLSSGPGYHGRRHHYGGGGDRGGARGGWGGERDRFDAPRGPPRNRRDELRDKERPMKIFVAGMPPSTTQEEYEEYFSKFGRVTDSVIMKNPDGSPRGFGFVTFDSREAADNAVNGGPHSLGGRSIDVKNAQPPRGAGGPPPSPHHHGGGGGHRGGDFDRFDGPPHSRHGGGGHRGGDFDRRGPPSREHDFDRRGPPPSPRDVDRRAAGNSGFTTTRYDTPYAPGDSPYERQVRAQREPDAYRPEAAPTYAAPSHHPAAAAPAPYGAAASPPQVARSSYGAPAHAHAHAPAVGYAAAAAPTAAPVDPYAAHYAATAASYATQPQTQTPAALAMPAAAAVPAGYAIAYAPQGSQPQSAAAAPVYDHGAVAAAGYALPTATAPGYYTAAAPASTPAAPGGGGYGAAPRAYGAAPVVKRGVTYGAVNSGGAKRYAPY